MLCFCTDLIFEENLVSEIKGSNPLRQLDCRIFKSITSPEQIKNTLIFFAWWYKFTKVKSYLMWPVLSPYSHRWRTCFYILIQIQESYKLIKWFLGGVPIISLVWLMPYSAALTCKSWGSTAVVFAWNGFWYKALNFHT